MVWGSKMKLDFDKKLAIANAIAEQISREQNLVSNRMTWNLTFQGFMIAAFALVAAAELTQPAKILLEVAISVAGAVVATVTISGVAAAQKQSDYLKAEFRHHFMAISPTTGKEETLPDFPYPRPFSVRQGSEKARNTSKVILIVLAVMWCVLLASTLAEKFLSPSSDDNELIIKVSGKTAVHDFATRLTPPRREDSVRDLTIDSNSQSR
jgi:hypothetical protein